jgi:hypothetical protein
MTRTARIQSIDAVKSLARSLRSFEEDAAAAVADLELQLNRIQEWITHERKDYWGLRLRRDTERLSEARINLQRRRAIFAGDDLGHSCHDEQKAVELAKRRVDLAETKAQAVRRWRHLIEREILEFRGTMNQLASFLQVDMPRAKALLERMIRALERYLAVETTAEAVSPPDWGTLLQETAPIAGETTAGEASDGASAPAAEISAAAEALKPSDSGILAQNCEPEQSVVERRQTGAAPAPEDSEA